jgi:hypothetical protein
MMAANKITHTRNRARALCIHAHPRVCVHVHNDCACMHDAYLHSQIREFSHTNVTPP